MRVGTINVYEDEKLISPTPLHCHSDVRRGKEYYGGLKIKVFTLLKIYTNFDSLHLLDCF